jgi:hypothetical protein
MIHFFRFWEYLWIPSCVNSWDYGFRWSCGIVKIVKTWICGYCGIFVIAILWCCELGDCVFSWICSFYTLFRNIYIFLWILWVCDNLEYCEILHLWISWVCDLCDVVELQSLWKLWNVKCVHVSKSASWWIQRQWNCREIVKLMLTVKMWSCWN